ncbi:MAG TPA: 2-dehydropantoate 2-reductase [Kofleriaceae bacterium]
MRFAVMGTGGAGGYFGARLAEAGHDVTFIARGAHLDAIRRDGLRVESVNGDVTVKPATATDDPATVGTVDYVLLGVKAWQVAESARALAPLMGPGTAVLPLQNGIDAAEEIGTALGTEHALGGTAKIISFLVGPGHIKHTGAAPTLEIGELDREPSARVAALREAFANATGVTIQVPSDIHVAMWSKFLFIASASGVGAVTRAPIGLVRTTPETRDLVLNAMREIEQLARARTVALAADAVTTAMAYYDNLPASGTTSMQRDLAEGRPSELDNLSGAAARLGAAHGIATPTHTFIYHALLLQERLARERATAR